MTNLFCPARKGAATGRISSAIRFRTLASAATAAALLVSPAAAVGKVATYTGTIKSGYDETGVFGVANTDITGFSYVARYTYDRTLGAFQWTDGVFYDQSYSGTYYGAGIGSPVISVSVTINGITKKIIGDYYGLAVTKLLSVHHVGQHYFNDGNTEINTYVQNIANAAGAASLDQNVSPVAQSLPGYGSVYFYGANASGVFESARADLTADGTYSVGNPVPEPAAWALMIAGFGLVGAALRRRERLAAV